MTDLSITMVGCRIGFSEPGISTCTFMEWARTTPSEQRARYTSDNAWVTAAMMILTERTSA